MRDKVSVGGGGGGGNGGGGGRLMEGCEEGGRGKGEGRVG